MSGREDNPDISRGLVNEDRFLRALLARHVREPEGGGLAFHARGACAAIMYATAAGRWRVTLERYE